MTNQMRSSLRFPPIATSTLAAVTNDLLIPDFQQNSLEEKLGKNQIVL